MEYDRALYRVYERVLEDLSLSTPIIEPRISVRQQEVSAPESSNRGTVASNLNTDDVNDTDDANGANDDNDDHIIENMDGENTNAEDFNNPTAAIFVNDGSMGNNRPESRTVPFLLPLFMSPYSDALMEALSKEGSWRRFWDTVRYHHRYHNGADSSYQTDTDSTDDALTNTATNGIISPMMRWIRSIRGSLVGPGPSFSRIDSSSLHPIFRTTEHQDNTHDNLFNARHSSFNVDGDGESDEAEVAIEMTTINTPSGLRRRPAMRESALGVSNSSENGDRDRQRHLGTSSISTSSSSSNSSNSGISSTFESNDTITTPTTRMAQQIAAAHTDDNNNTAQQRSNQNDDNNNTGGCTQKGIFKLMRATMIIGICHMIILVALHTTYVGAAASKLSVTTHDNASTNSDGIDLPGKKLSSEGKEEFSSESTTLISRTCIEYALATRPPQQRSQYFRAHDEDDNMKGAEKDNEKYKQDEQTSIAQNGTSSDTVEPPPLLAENEILQIIILYGGESCTGQCSRVHAVRHSLTSTAANKTEKEMSDTTRYIKEQVNEHANHWFKGWGSLIHTPLPQNRRLNILDGKQLSNEKSMMSSAKFWEEPDFKYSSNEALMYLENKMLRWHNVSLVNVTLTERCLSTGTDNGQHSSIKARFAQFLSNVYGMNVIIINQLMYGIKINGNFQDGYIQNVASKERWSWNGKLIDTERNMRSNAFTWLSHKISVVFTSILAFFLVTSVTAVTVRVLTSSGVVIMFPIFALFRHFGLNGADDRILGFSYPWIGFARLAIHRQRLHPQTHFVFAHLAKLFLFYIMYEACQSTWSSVLYRRSIPENLPLWLFGYAMVWEYFSMIFVRSALSAYFFPRITLLYFMCYHIYFYSVPYGFFDIALIPWFLFMLHAMCFTIISLEVPGSARGVVSLECPREVYSRLSWPEWSASLPNEWSLFMPLNSRYVPLHDRQVGDGDDANDTDADNEGEVENDAEAGAEIEMQDMNQDETVNGGEDLMLPLGNDDTNRQPALRRII